MIAFWRTYGIKSLFHPGMFFCGLWLCATTSFFILSLFPDSECIVDVEMVNELHSFVLFTALFFLIVKNWGKGEILANRSIWRLDYFHALFRGAAIGTLVLAIIDFIARGANFNALEARLAMVDYDTAMFYGEQSQSFLMTLIGVGVSVNYILCVVAGFEWGRNSGKINGKFLMLPLITGLIESIAVGGRLGVFWVLCYYFFGVSISGNAKFSRVQLKRILGIGIVLFILFTIFSSWVYQQRALGRSKDSTWNQYPVLAPVVSVINYFGSTYVGYQYRRNDFVTAEPEMGKKSFGGLIFMSIPFSAHILGRESSLGAFLGLEQYTQKQMFLDLAAEHAPFFSSISPMYMLLYDDFGYLGTLVVCFGLVLLSHYIYLSWFRSPHERLISIYFPLISFCFWSSSFFDPFTSTASWKVLLLCILLLEIINIILPRKLKEVAADLPVCGKLENHA